MQDDYDVDIDQAEANARSQVGTLVATALPEARLDPEMWQLILEASEAGLPLVRACHLAGVSSKVVNRILSQHEDMATELKQRRAMRSADMLQVISSAALHGEKPDWRAAQAFLALTDPRLGRPKDTVKTVVQNNHRTLVIEGASLAAVKAMTIEELRAEAGDAG